MRRRRSSGDRSRGPWPRYLVSLVPSACKIGLSSAAPGRLRLARAGPGFAERVGMKLVFAIGILLSSFAATALETYPGDDFASGDELCAVRSKFYGTHPLAQGLEYDVTEEKCAEWNRIVILTEHVDKNAGHLRRDDEGVARFKNESRNLFCHYRIIEGAKEIPEEARRWIEMPKGRASNPKSSPDYKVLKDYAEEAILFECQDSLS